MMTPQTFIIVVGIPLVSRSSFECFEIKALPFKHNEQDIILTKLNKHIWINEREETFQPNDVKECIKSDGRYYCNLESAIMKMQGHKKCEIQLFRNETTSDCMYEKSETEEQWTAIEKNIWLFATKKPTQLKIKCTSTSDER